MNFYAGIEAGGTTFKCIIANNPSNVIAESVFSTTEPETTLPQVVEFVKSSADKLGIHIAAAGLSCFGPVDLDPDSSTYGYITTTPKLKWRNFPILHFFRDHLSIPVHFETDVNGAALGEGRWGAAQGFSNYVYITVGTGIGGGIIHQGKPIYGMTHPEIGHMKIQLHPDDSFPGNCPYHGNCLEGLANAPAIEARWHSDPAELPDDHRAWDFEAYYLAQAIHNLVLICSPERVILGGGVLKRSGLLDKVRIETIRVLNGYIQTDFLDDINNYIVSPLLGDRAGALGAIALINS